MILIGQYDSPFVRRVALAMRFYGIAFEHRPWSTFGDADKIAPYNPLRRVPTLVLDNGEALIESTAILDHLDELAREQDKVTGEAMIAPGGAARGRPTTPDAKRCRRARKSCSRSRRRAGIESVALPRSRTLSPCGRGSLREAKRGEGSASAETDPSSGVDCVHATFSHRGRRE